MAFLFEGYDSYDDPACHETLSNNPCMFFGIDKCWPEQRKHQNNLGGGVRSPIVGEEYMTDKLVAVAIKSVSLKSLKTDNEL